MNLMNSPLHCLLLSLFVFSVSTQAENWPRFRGPNGTGISQADTIPSHWSEEDIHWKVALPGIGHSSPVVWGDKLFLLSMDEKNRQVLLLALGTTEGKELWRRSFSIDPFRLHRFNTFASSTPAVDEDRVYAAWVSQGNYRLIAFDHEGNKRWERDLGAFESQHGYGTSPIVYRDKVIITKDQIGESFVIALDRASGKSLWKVPRPSERADYSTPCIYTPENEDPILICNSMEQGISGLDPETGEVLWAFENLLDKRSVSSPVLADGLIIGSCGSGQGGNYVVAVRPGSRVQKPELIWQIRSSAPYVPTFLAKDRRLYLWSDGGIVTCVDPQTAQVLWRERVGGNFFGSPVWVDGRLFCVSNSGEVVVLAAEEQYAMIARNPLNEPAQTTPAVADGRMYIRTLKHLYCIGDRSLRAAR